MQIRQWLNENPQVTTIAAVVGLVIALIILFVNLFGGGENAYTDIEVYFYDMQTEELFTAEAYNIPPITAPSGGQGVRAMAYTIEGIDGPVVGYLLKYSPEAKQLLERIREQRQAGEELDQELMMQAESLEISSQGQLVKLPGDDNWIPMNSSEGMRIQESAVQRLQQEYGTDARVSYAMPE